MRVVRFQAWHLSALDRDPEQDLGADEADAQGYEDGGPAWTVIGDRLPIACAGFILAPWSGQGLAWSILGLKIGRAHLAFTRRVRLEFERSGLTRIEAMVRSDHAAGHRWCRAIGMAHEGTMRRWGPKAIDHDVYAKVRA